ncbi:hypothetical protein Hanom_Chr06g00482361 [Helianthus anomalus]
MNLIRKHINVVYNNVVCISISFWPISHDFENGCTCALWAKRNVAKAEEHHQETLQRGGEYYCLLANSQISSEINHCITKVRNLQLIHHQAQRVQCRILKY